MMISSIHYFKLYFAMAAWVLPKSMTEFNNNTSSLFIALKLCYDIFQLLVILLICDLIMERQCLCYEPISFAIQHQQNSRQIKSVTGESVNTTNKQ